MNKPSLKVVRNETDSTAKILLYGIIGSYDYWSDEESYLTAKTFVRLLSSLEAKYNVIDVHIHSPGGDVWEGLAICNAIKASKKTINTHNDGIAMSMGACILACGKNRYAAKGSITMIHNASTISWGTADTLRQDADMLDTTDDVLAEYFADAMGKTVAEIKTTYFDHKDHFLTAKQCEDLGLITISDDLAQDVPENVHNMQAHQVAALYRGQNTNPQNNNPDMSLIQFNNPFKGISALAKVAANEVTDDQLKAVHDELEAEGVKGFTMVKTVDLTETVTNSEKVPGLEKEVTDLKTAQTTDQQTITDLKLEVANLKKDLGKPAAEATAPTTTATDDTPAGDKVVDELETPTDREYNQIKEVRNLIP
ncbi:MAG: Clp protease ClpP [Sphingobacteriales bacterium]|nr:MAG: Clp protease ClpP [Sphingobacteriales bacterium]